MTVPTGRTSGRPKATSEQEFTNYTAEGIPTAPTGLKAAGKKDWDRIWEVGTWLNRDQHYFLVRTYCQKVDELTEWQKELAFLRRKSKAKYGTELSVYEQSNGAWAPYPQVRLIQDGRAQLVAWQGEMKLSPSHLPEGADVDEAIDDLRKQNRG